MGTHRIAVRLGGGGAIALAIWALAAARAGEEGGSGRCDIRDQLPGAWKVLSARIAYDAGGGGALGGTVARRLEICAGGEWAFGSSKGTWSVREIARDDWKRWKIEPYGPWRMVVLAGWSGGEASGPIEESEKGPDFVWVVYRAEPPAVSAPGTVFLKLGRG